MPLVQAPLGAVIARSDSGIRSPKDLEGRKVGVTGLPSDNAILDSEVAGDGGDPSRVDPVTIGFKQRVKASDALRTGADSRTLTFTLSTTTP